jgi:hypothetical protein
MEINLKGLDYYFDGSRMYDGWWGGGGRVFSNIFNII